MDQLNSHNIIKLIKAHEKGYTLDKEGILRFENFFSFSLKRYISGQFDRISSLERGNWCSNFKGSWQEGQRPCFLHQARKILCCTTVGNRMQLFPCTRNLRTHHDRTELSVYPITSWRLIPRAVTAKATVGKGAVSPKFCVYITSDVGTTISEEHD